MSEERADRSWFLATMNALAAQVPSSTYQAAMNALAAQVPSSTYQAAMNALAAQMPSSTYQAAMNALAAQMPSSYQAAMNALATQVPSSTLWANVVAQMSDSARVATLAAAMAAESDLSAVAEVIRAQPDSNVDAADTPSRRPWQFLGLSELEIVAMITTAVFLVVYISFAIAMIHNPKLAELAHDDGPMPYEAALSAGGLTFWFLYARQSR
jgi:hypothetical protein